MMTSFSPERLYIIPALLIALVFHEYAHGKVADHLGDPTPRYHNRLTLNPLKHLDPIGVLVFWFAGFGWAKPVPINPLNFKGDRKKGIVLVSLAGPLTNLIIAFLAIILLRLQLLLGPNIHFYQMTFYIVWFNIILAVFNIIPIPPLDGSKVLGGLLPHRYDYIFVQLEQYGFIILMVLIFTGVIGNILLPTANIILTVLDSIVTIFI